MTVLGFGGYLESGKDAAADYLVEKHGFVKLGMSDVLAEALYTLNPVIPTSLTTCSRYQVLVDAEGYVAVKKRAEVRRLLQVLGTEVGRKLLGEDIWVDAISKKIFHLQDAGNKNIVVTGVRFQNEVALFNDIGHLVWVDRPSKQPDPSYLLHASEGSVTPQDFFWVLHNEGDLEELYSSVESLLAAIFVWSSQ